MPVAITCPSCRSSFRAPDQTIGKNVRCLKCQKPFLAKMATPDWVSDGAAPGPKPAPARGPVRPVTTVAGGRPMPARRQRSPLLTAVVFGVTLATVLGVFGLAGVWLYTARTAAEPAATSPSATATEVAQAATPPTESKVADDDPLAQEPEIAPPPPLAKEPKVEPEPKEPITPPIPEPKVEIAPAELPKTELPKNDPPKVDPPKTELPKTEMAKNDDPPKTEMPKTEPPKTLPKPPSTLGKIVPKTKAAPPADPKVAAQLKTSLDWLVSQQKPNGAFVSGLQESNVPATVATTTYACLSLMANDDRRHDQAIAKGAGYIIDNLFENKIKINLPPEWDQSNWKIGIGGLFMCEYYAWCKARDPRFNTAALDAILDRVVEEAFKRMEPSGGWGHTPTLKNPLGYVELQGCGQWILAAVGGAERLGRKVPQDKLKIALQFVEDSCNPGQGSVGYSPRMGQRGMVCPGRTGAAIFAFGLLKQHRHPLYGRMVVTWNQIMDKSAEGHGSLCLGMLSSALGARQMGDSSWKGFQSKFYPQVLEAAEPDGSFKFLTGKTFHSAGFDNKLGPVYNTAIYTLVLQLDRGKLRFVGQQHSG